MNEEDIDGVEAVNRGEHDYVRVKINGEWRLAHRVIAEKKIGRELKENEIAHHINEDKRDNRPENIRIMTNNEHSRHHGTKDKVVVECSRKQCREELRLHPGRYQYKKRTQDNIYCSKECLGKDTLEAGEPSNVNENISNHIIEKELKKGNTGYEIAKKHDWPRGTVYNRIRKNNLDK